MVLDAKRSSTTFRNPVAAAALTWEVANVLDAFLQEHIKVYRLPEPFGEPFQLRRVSGSSRQRVCTYVLMRPSS
jgi:hypothetical protein